MATPRFGRRLEKELQMLREKPPEGVRVISADAQKWLVELTGMPDTLYTGEVFTLQLKFSDKYPMDSPEVIFTGEIPVHPHIYTNGHICLDLLYDAWSPALSVSSTCVSLLSMLSSNTDKSRPSDNARYVSRARGSPKDTRWDFHDDKV